ncbi:MAG: hypothetical protein LKJ86_00490 [Oscillibacter sp.]|nr:hypothetical protein [Oscillibacter sp.]
MAKKDLMANGNALTDEELDNASGGANEISIVENPMPVAPGIPLPPTPGNPTVPTLEMPESPVTPTAPFQQNKYIN